MTDGPQVIHYDWWLPTRYSAERLMQWAAEYSVNQPLRGGSSMAEMVWMTGSVKQALNLLADHIPDKPRQIVRALLQPWPQGRYVDAYTRTGGILNLFTPPWGEAQDEVWEAMLAGWKAASFPDERARQQALHELEQAWNATPHPFFANLTPAQIMIGGGPRERALADGFLEALRQRVGEQSHESEGEALIRTVSLLRSWQSQRRPDGRTIFETLVDERNSLLARRAELLAAGSGGQE